jgi:hypothetical protein
MKQVAAFLCKESYKGGIHYEEFSNNTQEEEIEYVKEFIEKYITTDYTQ